MSKSAVLAALALVAAALQGADPVYKGPVKAEEVRVRDGVGNVMKKIAEGKEVTIAYLGGSITAMNGWRNLTTEWFSKTYPGAKFKEVHASIGGTGSGLGAFRLWRDALQYDPDLLFVEFATNDGSKAPNAIWRSMEGIVRQTWKHNPATDIVFTYTITAKMTNDYLNGVCPRAASAMEQLADHYGIPSIGFGPRVAAEVAAGRLVMSKGELETAVPKDAPRSERAAAIRLAKKGRTLFANDGVHPGNAGHGLYLKSIIAGFTAMKDSKPVDHKPRLDTPFISGNLENAKMVDIVPTMLSGSWRKLPEDDAISKRFSKRMGSVWYAQQPGDTIKFKFKGTSCRLYDLVGPDAGQVWITVDGKRSKRPTPRFDSYCTYHRISDLHVYDGPDGVHEVEVSVDKDQPSRRSVAFRLKDPDKELAMPKFQGTKFWPAKIMLVGNRVD